MIKIKKIKKKILLIKIIIIEYIIIFLYKNLNLKIAVCTMGKTENLYAKEFINYYLKLGVNHIYILDDNDLNTEKISDIIDNFNKKYVTIYNNIKYKIKNQNIFFT